ncbi:hypothetical protein HYFRA_00001634 [Hymenoscyphus fraxineus]|uniref:Phosphatidylethanolamine-binding protein n=1 Tax=Hymenoscyphus fraxineus TaxID=746836 RepID=A0A9N9L816_9HELO|nr:hypothetical protein HYFRA_00001634 [Hymenoscyphus fraxineus]
MVQLLNPLLYLQTIFSSNMTLSTYSKDLSSSLSKAGLGIGTTPLLPADFTPSTELVIKYGEKTVEFGNFLRTGETLEIPSVTFAAEATKTGSTYTLIMVDPDAPTPEDPKYAYWRHWVATGLQASSSSSENTDLSHTPVTKYFGPGPKDEVATPHRYLFLLYREPTGFKVGKEEVGGEEFVDRRSFKADDFAGKFGLELVSVNWFSGVGDAWKA